MAGKQKYSYDTEEWNRGQSDGRPSNWSPVVKKTTRNYIREAFQKAGINNVDDLSKAKATSKEGKYILDRMQGKLVGYVRNATPEESKTLKKGNWNAENEMRKRREAAKAQGKGNWNAQEEMRKRREAAMAKKKGK